MFDGAIFDAAIFDVGSLPPTLKRVISVAAFWRTQEPTKAEPFQPEPIARTLDASKIDSVAIDATQKTYEAE